MYRTIADFLSHWESNSDDTTRIFAALTDDSLSQSVGEGFRTLGRMAWHIVLTIPEMAAHTGLDIEGPGPDEPVPADAASIRTAYSTAAASLAEQIKTKWSDDTLLVEDDLYGETWKRGFTLCALVAHEIHHRGQMTVLMRQAELKVPGVFGPAREEWAGFGMQEPVI